MSQDAQLLGRLERLERSNGRLRRMLALNAAIVLVMMCLGLVAFADRSGPHAAMDADSLRVRELVVVDSNGVPRVRLGTSLPDAVIGGRRVPRGDAAAGVMLYDRTGQERGGYVTFDNSGSIAMTLDTRKGQVALFTADAEGGAAARLWRGVDWVEMRAASDGTRFSVGHNNRVVVQEPPMTKEEAAAACGDLKAEVAQVKPPPPDSVVLAACRQHIPDSLCRKCLQRRQ